MHKHVQGELVTQFYVSRVNSDLTEGRGGNVDKGVFESAEDAHLDCLRADVQGTDGSVVHRTYHRCLECPELIRNDSIIFRGSHWGRGKDFMSDGWRVDYSPLAQDPEYKEYLRLKNKFAGQE